MINIFQYKINDFPFLSKSNYRLTAFIRSTVQLAAKKPRISSSSHVNKLSYTHSQPQRDTSGIRTHVFANFRRSRRGLVNSFLSGRVSSRWLWAVLETIMDYGRSGPGGGYTATRRASVPAERSMAGR